MNTLFVGHNFIHLPEVTSTNDLAAELWAQHPPEGTLIRADHQTQGRGQRGSQWLEESGKNLTFSILLYPTFLAPPQAFDLSRMSALALWKALSALLPAADVKIKWPNDLVVNGRKIAGILLENQVDGEKISRCIVGIGLNVNQLHFPEDTYKKATSLALLNRAPANPEEVLDLVCSHLEAQYLALKAGKTAAMESDYLRNLLGYQEKVQVKIFGQVETRLLVGVDKQGRLALEEEGKLRYFDVKEAEVQL